MFLGVVTSALALAGLFRALSLTSGQRTARAHEAVSAELDRLAHLPPTADSLAASPSTAYVGLRAGWVSAPAQLAQVTSLTDSWRPPLEVAVSTAAAQKQPVLIETGLAGSTLIVGAQPATSGGIAWAAYLVIPSAYLQTWRQVGFGLAATSALLVVTWLWGMLAFRRQTNALQSALVALGKDLHTPVPRPGLAELVGIAEGVERMAADLRASREDTERLSHELAHKERLAALGRVVAGVAHEVRNPLASIKLRLDLTAAAHALPEAAKKSVEAASSEISRLDRLVSDLLIVAGKKTGPRRVLEVGALVRARAELLGPWAETHEVALRADGEGAAEADPESVARAVDNLLRNAIEASPRGATVEAHVIGDGSGVEVRVEDRGGGVEPAREKELFEPFFTTKSAGTGLGLAISRAIARAHGGELTYARAGAVTSFKLSLPRHATEAVRG